MTQVCPRCTRPTANAICETCHTQLLRDLAALPDLEAELVTQLARLARYGTAASLARSAERPLPYDLGASITLAAMRNTVTTWARYVGEQRASAWHATLDPIVVIAAHNWRTDEGAAELGQDLEDLRADITRRIDCPPGRRYLGVCDLADEHGVKCTGDVYAVGSEPPACIVCRSTHDPEQRLALIRERAQDQLVTAVEAAAALSIKPELIRKWAHRGRIQAHGSRDGHRVYRFAEVATRALDMPPSVAR